MAKSDIFPLMLGCIGGFLFGCLAGIKITEQIKNADIHTEKHGCEYVEKAECKQAWIKKGG